MDNNNIFEEFRKALAENNELIFEEIHTLFGRSSNLAVKDSEVELSESFHGYRIEDLLGHGTYGSVYLVEDEQSGVRYAMKVINLVNYELTKLLAREIALLYRVHHDNIVRMEHVFSQNNSVYILMEYVQQDLNSYFEMRKRPEKPKEWLKQILGAVAYLHGRNIIHRDIKPENILVSHDEKLKLADFGSAREWYIADVNLTPKVTTLVYRAPEILLGSETYSTTVDLWSIGCVFAQFETIKPLFEHDDCFDNQSELTTIGLIFEKLGTPTEESWPGVSSLPNFPEPTIVFSQPAEIIPHFDPEGNDLLKKLLCLNPKNRITAEEALEHPYLLGV